MYKNILILLVVCVYSGYSKQLPSYIKPCSVSAADFDDCCLQHAKEAIPHLIKGDRKYNIPILDPLVLPVVKLESGKDFSLVLNDVSFIGLEKADLKQIKFDLKAGRASVRAVIERMNVMGNYNIDGKILVLPIQGNGNINVTGVDIDIYYDLKLDTEKINGEDHLVPKEGKADLKLSRAYFHLDNLFNGNKELGDSTNQVLNDEWEKFLEAIKPVISETIAKVANNIVTGITSAVPLKDFFLK